MCASRKLSPHTSFEVPVQPWPRSNVGLPISCIPGGSVIISAACGRYFPLSFTTVTAKSTSSARKRHRSWCRLIDVVSTVGFAATYSAPVSRAIAATRPRPRARVRRARRRNSHGRVGRANTSAAKAPTTMTANPQPDPAEIHVNTVSVMCRIRRDSRPCDGKWKSSPQIVLWMRRVLRCDDHQAEDGHDGQNGECSGQPRAAGERRPEAEREKRQRGNEEARPEQRAAVGREVAAVQHEEEDGDRRAHGRLDPVRAREQDEPVGRGDEHGRDQQQAAAPDEDFTRAVQLRQADPEEAVRLLLDRDVPVREMERRPERERVVEEEECDSRREARDVSPERRARRRSATYAPTMTRIAAV